MLVEDGACGIGVGGEPVKVFLGELLGRIAGSVDDSDWVVPVEDRHGKGARPAGVGAGLWEAPRPGYQEGGLEGTQHEHYSAFVSSRKRVWRRVSDTRGRLGDGGEVPGSYETNPT